MARIAFVTAGSLVAAPGHPVVEGFFDRAPDVFAAADASHGFVARSERLPEQPHTWGKVTPPRCYSAGEPTAFVGTLSVWENLEAVAAYAYARAHGDAMKLRREWFVADGLPGFAAWWIADDHRPIWEEASERLDHLHEHGPTPFAFNFAKAFSEDGQPIALDPIRMREIAARNA